MSKRGSKEWKKKISKTCKRRGIKPPDNAPRLSGEKHPFWKGRSIHQRGYILLKAPNHPNKTRNNYVFEHRLVIEKQIGRYLHTWEVSHHINHIKTDNRPENLMAFKNSAIHRKFESNKSINPSDIIFDGRKMGGAKFA